MTLSHSEIPLILLKFSDILLIKTVNCIYRPLQDVDPSHESHHLQHQVSCCTSLPSETNHGE